jgi:hypothetical protein
LAETLGRVMGVNLPPEYGPARKATPVWRRQADISKAKRRLGFTAQVSLEEGLRRLVEWWLEARAIEAKRAGRSSVSDFAKADGHVGVGRMYRRIRVGGRKFI